MVLQPALLTGNVEERYEDKAMYRSRQPNKIKTESTYPAGSHGTIKFKVQETWHISQIIKLKFCFRLIIIGVSYMFT